ncbi:hypothetical protein P152DRAFT_66343 [Eremomyces bilateralis CBS 781.70]|uniref:Uncharacterized protein n=1 Tax=Eremomyces bilateralis CBS 781.70 TaxID=1392243 RepID=A0A6G1FZX7_9PEZI|nr:uncharacterized protein P152DRAFT_66343 [Eremomyces bilateralis CBS 781.70]KAF1811231.1 hypothetical protein P152DRAFT_66343 [Eremomyces bilateralis CBS 781.70]
MEEWWLRDPASTTPLWFLPVCASSLQIFASHTRETFHVNISCLPRSPIRLSVIHPSPCPKFFQPFQSIRCKLETLDARHPSPTFFLSVCPLHRCRVCSSSSPLTQSFLWAIQQP